MIRGNGIDLVSISRIEGLLSKKKKKFLERIFTGNELKYIADCAYNPQSISGIFASKEAVSKLLGTGIGKVNWKDIEIIHDERGKPIVRLHNYAQELSNRMGMDNIMLSISHEKEYAVASAIGESRYDNLDIDIPKEIRRPTKRDEISHKGSFGRIGIIAGSRGMTGAAYLTTMATLRSGSGLIYTIVPDSLYDIFAMKLIEAIIIPVEDEGKGYFTYSSYEYIEDIIKDMDVLAIGPGLGVDKPRMDLIDSILSTFPGPIVLDADGINCISKGDLDSLLQRKAPTIITPHPGELSRLLGIDIDTIQGDRIKYAGIARDRYDAIIVLKGANTLVADPGGDIFINPTGNPGMATAGSGDVLTGMIASFIGQGMSSYDASVLGVYCHGLAGDLAKKDKGEYGMISGDILDNVPNAIKILIK